MQIKYNKEFFIKGEFTDCKVEQELNKTSRCGEWGERDKEKEREREKGQMTFGTQGQPGLAS